MCYLAGCVPNSRAEFCNSRVGHHQNKYPKRDSAVRPFSLHRHLMNCGGQCPHMDNCEGEEALSDTDLMSRTLRPQTGQADVCLLKDPVSLSLSDLNRQNSLAVVGNEVRNRASVSASLDVTPNTSRAADSTASEMSCGDLAHTVVEPELNFDSLMPTLNSSLDGDMTLCADADVFGGEENDWIDAELDRFRSMCGTIYSNHLPRRYSSRCTILDTTFTLKEDENGICVRRVYDRVPTYFHYGNNGHAYMGLSEKKSQTSITEIISCRKQAHYQLNKNHSDTQRDSQAVYGYSVRARETLRPFYNHPVSVCRSNNDNAHAVTIQKEMVPRTHNTFGACGELKRVRKRNELLGLYKLKSTDNQLADNNDNVTVEHLGYF